MHSQVLQDVLLRLKKAFDAFIIRLLAHGENQGYPRFQGRNRYTSFTYVRHDVAPFEWQAAYTASSG
jgi:putative transposase